MAAFEESCPRLSTSGAAAMTAQNCHGRYWRCPWSLRNALRDLIENYEEREARPKSRHHVQVAAAAGPPQ